MIWMRNITTQFSRLETVSSEIPGFASLDSKLGELDPHVHSVNILQDAFVVNDLFEGYSYAIARSESGYRLAFLLKDGSQILVDVERGCDVTRAAQMISKKLIETGSLTQRLSFDRSLNSTGGA